MKSTTSLVAEEVRLRQWAMDIKECQNRPVNMTIEDWCSQHNLKKATYYYRLKKVREACLSMSGMEELPTFIEVKAPSDTDSIRDPKVSAMLTLSNGGILEIFDQASQEFLEKLFGAYAHAQ